MNNIFNDYQNNINNLNQRLNEINNNNKNEKGNFSEVVSETYFVTDKDLNKHKNRTVISLVTDPDNLFSPDYGIYVTGNMFQEWKNSEDFVPNLILGDDPRLKGNFL